MFKKKTRKILEQFEADDIVAQSVGANLFGVQSKGVGQLRGNGVLVLTADELYFEMWVGHNTVRIPVRNITGIENPKGFLGKRRPGLFLQVNFLDESGSKDAAAWQLADLTGFQSTLEELVDPAEQTHTD